MGLYDLSGNAEEWVHDFYAPYIGGAETDPVGPATGTDKVIRGGSFDDRARYGRVACRMKQKADIPWIEAGIRLVRTLP